MNRLPASLQWHEIHRHSITVAGAALELNLFADPHQLPVSPVETRDSRENSTEHLAISPRMLTSAMVDSNRRDTLVIASSAKLPTV
jgi:hypothetical protein